jgi:16S rRNA (adenine1518-N6/adenine1519-N6)-dimethyltransferase
MADSVPLNPPRQTLGYIRARLAEHGVSPKNKLGQNFLIDLNLLDVLLEAADLQPDDLVLEVGCGTGSLTARIADTAGAVLGVEVDTDLYRMVTSLLEDRANVRILYGDALKTKNELNPNIFEQLDELEAKFGTKRRKLVANLPYAVATPVIANLLLCDNPPERMVCTVQWEIGERLIAKPGHSEYGSLAVLVQSLGHVEIVRRLAPSVFWPRPQVDSAIVRIISDPEKRAAVGDVRAFRVFLRDLYVHKRKSLRMALVGWPSGRRSKEQIDALLSDMGIPGNTRAEQMDLETHLRLCRRVRELTP